MIQTQNLDTGINKKSRDHAATDTQLARAQKIRSTFKQIDRKFEEQRAATKAKDLGMMYFDISRFIVEQETLTILPKPQAVEAESAPFFKEGQDIKIGTTNPSNKKLEEIVDNFKKKNFRVQLYFISKSGLEDILSHYQTLKEASPQQEQVEILEEAPAAIQKLRELEQAGAGVVKTSATDLISLLVTSAQSMNASDIHLQPEKTYLSVRFRVDGVLQEMAKFNQAAYKPLVSRIKILSKLKINVTKVPQDGSFVITQTGGDLEIRVSLLPSAYGESIVLRLLGHQEALDLESLGMRGLAFKRIQNEINKPNGLILTTGPTGSGKTTALYAFLKRVNKPGVKIITLENPVEYRMEGIEQIQIDEKAGLTFSSALRSTLRQDPDVLMVGEIRDFDTAEAAAQAALTGHMVYSTLHTNDASGAIPRLLNLGVKPVILAPALTVVIAQRLIRRICQHCKQEEQLDGPLRKQVEAILSKIPQASGEAVPKEAKFYHSKGCGKCNNIGYKGRVGVYELFVVDNDMQQLIFKEASTVEIKELAIKKGMVTMIQDGLLKALEGITDVAEVFRVTEE